jgi:aryl-alcohol dehydrogenase-like predicted oxidoreductase
LDYVLLGKKRPKVSKIGMNRLSSSTSDVVPISGARNGAQARENVGAAGWKLSDGELKALSDVLDEAKLNYFP